jgi:hypothetical protein
VGLPLFIQLTGPNLVIAGAIAFCLSGLGSVEIGGADCCADTLVLSANRAAAMLNAKNAVDFKNIPPRPIAD